MRPTRSARPRHALPLAALVLAAASPGCATTWATTQLAGSARLWDEQVREAVVPLPGVEERLTVQLPLLIEYEPAPATTTTAAPATPAAAPTPRRFALTCTTTQRGQDEVYHSAFRYGSTWKKGTAIMFLAEGLTASALLLLGDRTSGDVVYGGFLAVDAAATAALFFAPRKEIYRRDVRPVITPVRRDCPDGTTLDIAGEVYAVDAAGRLGELGDTALDDWMQAPTGALRVGVAGHSVELVVDAAARCTWNRHRQRPPAPGCAYAAAPAQYLTASLVVAAGTLTRAE